MSFLNRLEELLKRNEKFINNNKELLKIKIIETAKNTNNPDYKDLLKLLLNDEEMKEEFFEKIEDITIFNKDHFVNYLKNKQFLSDSYTKFEQSIGFNTKEQINNNVVLNFPYKDCILEGGQTTEDGKKNEIFFNEILAKDEISRLLEPKVLDNFKKYNVDGDKNFNAFERNKEINKARNLPANTITDNLLIKGNNLLALHTLQEEFRGKVKLIYIDPPYNTGNDSFNYNDNFNHSTWLCFMKNRLEVARELLKDDGVIFVQCDDNEQAYLKVLMDEVMGRENFVNHITIKVKSSAGFKTINKGLMETSEYILLYGKNKNKSTLEKIFIETGYDKNYDLVINNIEDNYKLWKIKKIKDIIQYENINSLSKSINNKINFLLKEEFAIKNSNKVFRYTAINDDAGKETLDTKEKSKNNNEIFKVNTNNGIRYIHKGQQITFFDIKLKNIDNELLITEQLTNIWNDIKWEGIANEGCVVLKKGKKPEKLIKRIIEISTQPHDIVLDFFAGSGTTGAVAHKMNRQWIMIEQMDYIETITKERIKKVIGAKVKKDSNLSGEIEFDNGGISKNVNWQGGGEFIYFELKKYNEIFVKQLEKAETKEEVVEVFNSICEKGLPKYNINIKNLKEDIEKEDGIFLKKSLEEMKKDIYSILNKNMLYVPKSLLGDSKYVINKEDIELNKSFYSRGL